MKTKVRGDWPRGKKRAKPAPVPVVVMRVLCHAPPPWVAIRIHDGRDLWTVRTSERLVISPIWGEANARLVAASPTLYEAAYAALHDDPDAKRKLRAALQACRHVGHAPDCRALHGGDWSASPSKHDPQNVYECDQCGGLLPADIDDQLNSTRQPR